MAMMPAKVFMLCETISIESALSVALRTSHLVHLISLQAHFEMTPGDFLGCTSMVELPNVSNCLGAIDILHVAPYLGLKNIISELWPSIGPGTHWLMHSAQSAPSAQQRTLANAFAPWTSGGLLGNTMIIFSTVC